MSYAIAAAGTGGHVFPALAVAEELVKGGVDRGDVVFLGGSRLEATAVPAAGFPLVALRLQGLKRSLSPANLRLPLMVARAARSATAELRARGVRALLAMGGYVTVPAALASRRAGVPLVIHEQNGTPGLANRLVARLAARRLCAFPAASARLRGAEVVGNPIRAEFSGFDREGRRPAARRRYGLDPDLPVLGVMGGSLGAAVLNDVAARLGASERSYAIVHLAGRQHAADVQRRAAGAPVPWVVVPFEDSMPDFYAACDLVLSRAGALAISELAATATPAVVVPLAAVAQQGNAAQLADAGGAVVLDQSRIDAAAHLVPALLGDRDRLGEMSAAAAAVARPDAAARVAEVLVEVAR